MQIYLCIVTLVAFTSSSLGDVISGRNPGRLRDCGSFHQCEPGDELENEKPTKGCYCDYLCSLYGDCCSNAAAEPWPSYGNIVEASVCRRVKSLQLDYDLYMVTSCPSDFEDERIRGMCENVPFDTDDMLLKVPVSQSTYGIAFANIFCALCHRMTLDEVFLWAVNFTCEFPKEGARMNSSVVSWDDAQSLSADELLGMGMKCHEYLSVQQGRPKPRGCLRGLRSTCSASWDDPEVEEQCQTQGTQVVSVDRTGFKNKYCAKCNRITRYSCKHQRALQSGSVINAMPASALPLSILLDFNSGLSFSSLAGRNCADGELYDIVFDRCRALTCASGYTLKNDHCIVESHPQLYGRNISLLNQSVCPQITLEHDEYTIIGNGTIYLNSTQKVLQSTEYQQSGDGQVLVCSDDLLDHTSSWRGEYTINTVVQGILSLVGQVISVTSLLILLTVYACFPKLRNIPGKCLMSLAASLAAAQTMFIVGMYATTVPILCKMIAILTHYFFMVAFCWMNVMAVDVWRTFHQKFRVSARSRKVNHFIFYTLYSVIVPMLVVAMSIVFDELDIANVPTPQYGHHFCWISQKEGLLYLFVLPVFILISVNCILFSISVYHICKSSDGSVLRESNKGAKKKRLILYTKLSTIMGLTWVFGFAASVTGTTVLWYLYIICNSLQGLFICLAFLCSRKVYRLVVTSYESRTSKSQTTTTSTYESSQDNRKSSYKKKGLATADEIETLQSAPKL